MIAAPAGGADVHLEALSRLSTLLMNPGFKENLIAAKDKDEFERMIKEIYEGKLPSLRENGRKAVENMDIKKIGEKLVKIYNGTAEGGD